MALMKKKLQNLQYNDLDSKQSQSYIYIQQQFQVIISNASHSFFFNYLSMNKRKLQLNELKKKLMRGKKQKLINTKYQVAMAYFKQKDVKNAPIFTIYFQLVIRDLLEQLTNAQLVYKCENNIKDQMHQLEILDNKVKFEGSYLKYYSKEYPVQEIVDCLEIKKDLNTKKLSLQLYKNKYMLYLKHFRKIFPEFCFCVGEKIIIEDYDIKIFYETFKSEWVKLYDRGRMSASQKIERLICRSLYFIGALIQNNIFEDIEQQERKKREQTAEFGTKSEKKKNVRGITHQVSSTYSFGSTDMLSNFSCGLKSQKSNEEQFCKTGFSQKSQKIVRKQRCFLWEKAEIKNLKLTLPVQHPGSTQNNRYEVDLLSNDVQNILIQQAFKIQKLKDACGRNRYDISQQYPYQAYINYYQQPFYPSPYQQSYIQQPNNYVSEEPDLYSLRRSFNFTNLVETRKTQSRLGGNKYS